MQPQDAKPTVAPLDGRGAPAGAMAAPTGSRRDEIVDAARSLYEEKGLSRTTIQDITARLGVTRSLFYHLLSQQGCRHLGGAGYLRGGLRGGRALLG